jgi:hypothetical protein
VRIIVLGPQRRPTVDTLLRSLGLDGPVATITAGWQEREPDDAELGSMMPGEAVNLGLYRRWLDVQDRDGEYAVGERRLQGVLAEWQDLYLLRLDHALRAVHALLRRGAAAGPAVTTAVAEAIAAVRELDAMHLKRVNVVRREFFEMMRPHDRPVIAEHRAFVESALSEVTALVVAGGHVGVLTDLLHLFNVAPALRPRAPVIAWSAGAMALADRIVLFHDRAPQGPGHPEIYGSGLSMLRDVVLLPHARDRLLLDDTARMAVFARRFAPARCVLLEQGTKLDTGGTWLAAGRVLGEDGRVGSPMAVA